MTETNEILIDDIKSQIYDLYSIIKSSLTKSEKEKVNNDNNHNKEITSTTEISLLINYLKAYINFLVEEKKNSNIFYKQLESYILKLENEIKFDMKKHFQNKIQKDSLEMKIRAYIQIEEEYEELKEKVKYEDGKFLDNDRKDNEIIILRRENSNLKKEITKLEEENKEIIDLKEQNKDLEKQYNDDEEIIKGLKYKNNLLNNKIQKLEEELTNTKNNLTCNDVNSKTNENNSNLIHINDNNSRNKNEYYNSSGRKISIEKYKLNTKNKILKQGITNYQLPSHLYSYESNKNNHNNHSTRTIDTNKYIVSTYNKLNITGYKNLITPIKNDFYINTKKIKNNSVIKEESEKSELMNKYLSGSHTINKYIKHVKSRSLNKLGNNIPGYKLPVSNNSIKKLIQRETLLPYEHSALNIIGINKKIN